jgi:membrane protease YdiL (CAAX protease family)
MTNEVMAAGEASPPATAPRTGVAWAFFGSDGLRAGWSILLYFCFVFAIGALVIFTLRTFVARLPHSDAMSALQTMRTESVSAAAVLVAALLMSLIERRRFAAYGIKRHRAISDLILGLFWGLIMLSALIGLLVATQSLSLDGAALAPQAALISGLQWAAAFLLVGVFEEFLFRGYLQFTLARGIAGITRAISPSNAHAATIGWWVAALLLSVGLFAALHVSNTGETAVGILGVAMAGTIFAFSLWRTGSLWWGIGFHASWDWAQSYLYGVADSGTPAQGHLLNSHAIGNPLMSGGSVGPEGSVLLLPVLVATMLVIHLTLPKRVTS